MISNASLSPMNFVIKLLVLFSFAVVASDASGSPIEEFVKKAAISNGLKPPSEINPPYNPGLAELGSKFFATKSMSINGDISCQTCHLDKFGSADGIPNAVGVGGQGEGSERILRGGAVLPRNTLPLWGRALPEFKTFFWDGKVDFSNGRRLSQFGDEVPTDDPLLIAIHLPVVEIREMLAEDKFVAEKKNESVSAAEAIYSKIMERLRRDHNSELIKLSKLIGGSADGLTFHDIAKAIKAFFASKFAVQEHKFSKFVFGDGKLDGNELKGAYLFYGKGKCSVCHSGNIYSDLSFYAVPLGQLGSGKNGFGVDYGRFNVTHDPADLYKFRTPSLLDVKNTAPYGHSGAQVTIQDAIIKHFDPIKGISPNSMTSLQRVELYKQLAASGASINFIPYLNEKEVGELTAFLGTLSFSPITK